MARKDSLRRLLQPKTVAVFGGDSAVAVIRQCQAIDYAGEIWAVNPTRSDLAGVPCVASIDDLPGVPDASFVAAPPEASLAIIGELAERGAPGAVCFAAGFAETGEVGGALQVKLQAAARDMAVIGPNCYGFLNYLDGVALWPDEHGGQRVKRGIALITQSGNIALNLTMQQRSVDFAYVISIGNTSSLGLHDYLDMLLDDPRVSAIALHVEGIRDITRFSEVAIQALRKGVPIVALKTGRSTRGAEITMSHTGSLAGSDRLYSTLFKRVGVARCDTVPQFLETMKFLSIVGPLQTSTLGSMSCSGGEASLVADHAAALGIEMPALSAESTNALQNLLGARVNVANPLDYHLYIWGDYDQLYACFARFLSNGYGCSLLVLDYPSYLGADQSKWLITERALIDAVAETGQRAVVVASLPETLPADARQRLAAAGIAPMQGIEDCIFAVRAAAECGMRREVVDSIVPVNSASIIMGKVETLDEVASKAALAKHGLVVPTGKVCEADQTAAVATEIGFPVVLKAVSKELAHKSEAGAVAVNLQDAAAVLAATEAMGEQFDRFLVEAMAGPTVAELIVGVNRDTSFGLSLLIGAGGTLVELLDNTVSLLLPASREDIKAAVKSLKIARVIDAYRGGPAGDLDAVLDAIEAIARYAFVHREQLQELDVNPLLVTPDSAIAVDAFIRVILPATKT